MDKDVQSVNDVLNASVTLKPESYVCIGCNSVVNPVYNETVKKWFLEGDGEFCPSCITKNREKEEFDKKNNIKAVKSERKMQSEKEEFKKTIPKRYWKTRFRELEQRFIEAAEMLFTDEMISILYLWGDPGNGKTWTSWAIAKESFNRNIGARFYSVPDLFQMLREEIKSDKEIIIKGLQEYKGLLVLDELDKRNSDFVQQSLYRIINHRDNELLKTVVTSNLSIAKVEEFHSPRLASRLQGGVVREFTGEDRRKNNR